MSKAPCIIHYSRGIVTTVDAYVCILVHIFLKVQCTSHTSQMGTISCLISLVLMTLGVLIISGIGLIQNTQTTHKLTLPKLEWWAFSIVSDTRALFQPAMAPWLVVFIKIWIMYWYVAREITVMTIWARYFCSNLNTSICKLSIQYQFCGLCVC